MHHANYRARYHDILKEILAGDHPVQALVGVVNCWTDCPSPRGHAGAGDRQLRDGQTQTRSCGIDLERFASASTVTRV